MSKTIILNWEYHPIYGVYSRLVYTLVGKGTYTCRREYRDRL